MVQAQPLQHVGNGAGKEDQAYFDPSAPPPFKIANIRAAIPKHCWEKNTLRSLSYVLRDVLVVTALVAAAIGFNSWFFWPLYWPAQGTMFWALFVLGHDCDALVISFHLVMHDCSFICSVMVSSNLIDAWNSGHGSFSNSPLLNSIVGHILHSSILVPYHGWRISHRTHHQNHGHVEKDESWVPWSRSPGKEGSHFNPYSNLFSPGERRDIFVMWLDFVTYLHHHGYKQKLPWYRGQEWSYLRGGLTTVDRDYGWINNIHHDIGTHVIHHLFPQIPHYHLIEATKAAKAVLGKYYREPQKSGPLPLHLIKYLLHSISQDHFVSDSGDIVYYQTDSQLHKDSWTQSN
ncbi:hypothetical protein JHK84_049424 [Glycine max]|nr:hypothetical protein JHK84_049424 [Glycine max]